MKKDTLKARAQSAKSARAINDMVSPTPHIDAWSDALGTKFPCKTGCAGVHCKNCALCMCKLFDIACVQVAGLSTSSALGAFEKMEDKVLAMEAEAEAAMQVGNVGCPHLALKSEPYCLLEHPVMQQGMVPSKASRMLGVLEHIRDVIGLEDYLDEYSNCKGIS